MATERKPLSKRLRFEIFKRDGFRCTYCGSTSRNALLHVDHIDAVADGGTDDPNNLVTACESCNAGKGSVSLHRVRLLKTPRSRPIIVCGTKSRMLTHRQSTSWHVSRCAWAVQNIIHEIDKSGGAIAGVLWRRILDAFARSAWAWPESPYLEYGIDISNAVPPSDNPNEWAAEFSVNATRLVFSCGEVRIEERTDFNPYEAAYNEVLSNVAHPSHLPLPGFTTAVLRAHVLVSLLEAGGVDWAIIIKRLHFTKCQDLFNYWLIGDETGFAEAA